MGLLSREYDDILYFCALLKSYVLIRRPVITDVLALELLYNMRPKIMYFRAFGDCRRG